MDFLKLLCAMAWIVINRYWREKWRLWRQFEGKEGREREGERKKEGR